MLKSMRLIGSEWECLDGCDCVGGEMVPLKKIRGETDLQ